MDLDIVHAIRILRKYAGHDEHYEDSKSLEEIT